MKAVISVQFGDFSRTMLVVEHEVSTDLADLARRIRQVKGVRNAAVITSHLQDVKFVSEGQDAVEVVKLWASEQ